MRLLSAREIKNADALTIEKQGINSLQLMERAALGFVASFLKRFPDPGKGLIICGPGNNGGDGLAIARLISDKLKVSLYLPDIFSSFSSDYGENLKRLPNTIQIFLGDFLALKEILHEFDWICDALFGIGFNRPPDPVLQDLIVTMNAFPKLKIAVDTPTGFRESELKKGQVFEADWVGTFHAPKLKFMFPESQKFISEFQVIDIQLTIPETNQSAIYFLEKSDVAKRLKSRQKFSHKGTFGHGLLIAGSEGKMGAAVISTAAMLRSGIGLVSVLVPKVGRDVLQITNPEAMIIVDKQKKEVGNLPLLGSYQSIGIGPGIGKGKSTQELVKQLLEQAICPLILDADALNILSENKDWLKLVPQNTILTPHPKEFERLAGKSNSDEQLFQKALEFSKKYKVFLVLKSAHTLICFPDGNAYFNSTGNAGMAKGGSGDALTGTITGLLAQRYRPGDACLIGVFVHGFAGDLAAAKKGQIGMTVSDLIDEFPSAFLELSSDLKTE